MKKKKLKKKLKVLRHDIDGITKAVVNLSNSIAKHHCICENYKPKTVTFKRFVPLPDITPWQEGKPIPKLKEEVYERKAGGESGGETYRGDGTLQRQV